MNYKECPFCGTNDALSLDKGEEESIYYISCNRCDIEGPIGLNAEQAVSRWENRNKLNQSLSARNDLIKIIQIASDRLKVKAISSIKPGTVIYSSNVIIVDQEFQNFMYTAKWFDDKVFILPDNICFIKHSSNEDNCKIVRFKNDFLINLVATRLIKEDEELCLNFNLVNNF